MPIQSHATVAVSPPPATACASCLGRAPRPQFACAWGCVACHAAAGGLRRAPKGSECGGARSCLLREPSDASCQGGSGLRQGSWAENAPLLLAPSPLPPHLSAIPTNQPRTALPLLIALLLAAELCTPPLMPLPPPRAPSTRTAGPAGPGPLPGALPEERRAGSQLWRQPLPLRPAARLHRAGGSAARKRGHLAGL